MIMDVCNQALKIFHIRAFVLSSRQGLVNTTVQGCVARCAALIVSVFSIHLLYYSPSLFKATFRSATFSFHLATPPWCTVHLLLFILAAAASLSLSGQTAIVILLNQCM